MKPVSSAAWHEGVRPARRGLRQGDIVPQDLHHSREQQTKGGLKHLERAFVEERRCTKVIPHLWAEGDVVMLVYGVLLRVSERWGKKCFRAFEQQQLRSLRAQLKLDEQEVSTGEVSLPVHTRRSAASAA